MKCRYFIYVLIAVVSGCATISKTEKAGVEVGTVYKFSNPKIDSSLYVKFIPQEGGETGLIFSTIPNSRSVSDIKSGEENTFKQDWYIVSDEGKVTFRFYQKGFFKDFVKNHKYFISGSQNGDEASFRYRLDFKNAEVIK